MRIPRVYHTFPLSHETVLNLQPQAAVHLLRVLRLQVGDPLILFDGKGQEVAGEIIQITKQQVTVSLGKLSEVSRESTLTLTLGQSFIRQEKMEWVLQKAVELGVKHFVPLETEFSQIKLDADRFIKRQARWQEIITNASEQCGRNCLLQLQRKQSFRDWIAHVPTSDLRIIFTPEATVNLEEFDRLEPTAVTLAIGPEGGFSPEEIDLAGKAGFYPIKLGPRILRTETAALAAVSIVQNLWGDLQ